MKKLFLLIVVVLLSAPAYAEISIGTYIVSGSGTPQDPYVANIAQALADASSGDTGLVFPEDKVFLTSTLLINNLNAPVYIIGANTTLKAAITSSGNLITLENVHGKRDMFSMSGFIIDSNGKTSSGLYIHGMQNAEISNIRSSIQ